MADGHWFQHKEHEHVDPALLWQLIGTNANSMAYNKSSHNNGYEDTYLAYERWHNCSEDSEYTQT
jgi:hypothetical protein